MSKKSFTIFIVYSLYIKGKDFLDIQCTKMQRLCVQGLEVQKAVAQDQE